MEGVKISQLSEHGDIVRLKISIKKENIPTTDFDAIYYPERKVIYMLFLEPQTLLTRTTFCAMLEMARSTLNCHYFVACVRKNQAHAEQFTKALMFLGFKVFDPENNLSAPVQRREEDGLISLGLELMTQ